MPSSRLLLTALTALIPLGFMETISPAKAAKSPDLVILDNDFEGPATSNIQSIIPLLNNPRVKLLGIVVAIGDDWENAASAHARRFLEIAKQTQIPVADGATMPLVETRPMLRLREMRYGEVPWKGAWGGLGSIDKAPNTQPPVGKLPEGNPALKPIAMQAALFMIQQVHAHPHQVTILEGGPMTNLALAIRLDPTFAETAKELIFMGGYIGLGLESATGNADNASDFNFLMDPEAAHITLTAPWPAITSVSNVSNDVFLSKEDMQHFAASHHTPVTDYMAHYYAPMPMWDETASMIFVDPSLIKRSVEVYMDADISQGAHRGSAVIWSDALAPKSMGVRKVRIIQAIDTPRLLAKFKDAASHAVGSH